MTSDGDSRNESGKMTSTKEHRRRRKSRDDEINSDPTNDDESGETGKESSALMRESTISEANWDMTDCHYKSREVENMLRGQEEGQLLG